MGVNLPGMIATKRMIYLALKLTIGYQDYTCHLLKLVKKAGGIVNRIL